MRTDEEAQGEKEVELYLPMTVSAVRILWGALTIYWKNDRLSCISTGIGKMMSMTSVMMFKTPQPSQPEARISRLLVLPSVIN
jgi:hypothetical protein